jgi:hypothetical protein
MIIPIAAGKLPPLTLVSPLEIHRNSAGHTTVTPRRTRDSEGILAIKSFQAASLEPDALVTPVETREEGGRTAVYPIGMELEDGSRVGALW